MIIEGIDVSEFQGNIDWYKVKNDGIKFAIIRYADGSYIDRYFHINMAGAIKAGLHVGAYIYSRAVNAAQAREEAQRIIKACAPYAYDMPLYIDLEADNLKHIANMLAQEFIKECEKNNVKGGVYANLYWFNSYIDPEPIKNKPLWLAQWNKTITASDPGLFGLWQYSSSGSVEGIDEPVDLDRCYVEYWEDQPNDNSNVEDDIKKVCASLAEKTKETLKGKYGTGAARVRALGDYYSPVQWIINKVLEE